MRLEEWINRYSGGETEVRELAESLVKWKKRRPALSDDAALCAAARELLEAMDLFDVHLERVGFGK